MSAYVARLIARANGQMPAARPRLPSRFEPSHGAAPDSAVPAPVIAEAATPPSSVARTVTPSSPPSPVRAQAFDRRGTRAESIPQEPAVPQPGVPVETAETKETSETPPISRPPNVATEPAAPLETEPAAPSAVPAPVSAPLSRQAPTAVIYTEQTEVFTERTEVFAQPVTSAHPPAPALPQPTPPRRAQPAASESEEFVVEVTIGRVDVRAIMPELPRPARKSAQPRRSLDDYLAQMRSR